MSGKRVNHKGRNKHAPFVGVYRSVYDSQAYQALSPRAKAIYWEIRRRYNSYNNGYIGLSLRDAAKVIHGSTSTAAIALAELQAHGLIRLSNKGVYQNRHATTWTLTDAPLSDSVAPTNDWRNYAQK